MMMMMMMMMMMTTIHPWHRGLGVGGWVLLLLLLMMMMVLLMTMMMMVVVMMMLIVMMMVMMITTTIHPGPGHRVSGRGRLGAAVPGGGQGPDPAGRGHQRPGPSAELRHPPHHFRHRSLRAGHSGMLHRRQGPTLPAGLGGRLLYIVGAVVVSVVLV